MNLLNFPLGANFYQKLAFLAILGPQAHIYKATMVKVGVIVGTWDLPPHANFVKKIAEGILPFWANLYLKLPILAILTPPSPHFKSHNHDVWLEATDLGHPSPRLIL